MFAFIIYAKLLYKFITLKNLKKIRNIFVLVLFNKKEI